MNVFAKSVIAAATLAIFSQVHAEPTAANAAPNAAPANAAAPNAAAAAPMVVGANVNVSADERAKIEQVVHQYLLQKPEIIIEAVQNYQRKQYEQAEQTVKKTQQTASSFAKPLFHQVNDPISGNPGGKITVVEFFDYQCPHCIDMAPIIDGLIKNNPDVRVVFKEFPIRGPVSDYAARAALAANKQGKYYEFSHALLIAPQPISQDSVLQVAKNVGLDVEKLKKDMADKTVDEQIKNNVKLAKELQLFGTPAFFIGKTDVTTSGTIDYVPGKMDLNQLQGVIDKNKKA